MKTDIFIKTCKYDEAYHGLCLASIDKYCTGFGGTVVVNSEHPNGYLEQQVVKLHADLHCDGDYILVTDSDTLFTEPVTPESFMVDGKPMWFVIPYSDELLEHAGMKAWYDVMGQYFSEVPPYEFMRRQPFMFPRWLTEKLRADCLERHGMTIEDYIYSKGVFSEWNVLGFYAWLYHRDSFHWIDCSQGCPLPKARQFWSHTPLEENIEEIQRILA